MKDRKQLFKFTLCIIILYFSVGMPIQAEEFIVVRAEGEFSPYEMHVNNVLAGIHVDLISLASKNLGFDLEIKTLPWKRAIKEVQLGTADAISYIGYTDERAEFLYFLEGNIISEYSANLFVRKSDDPKDRVVPEDLSELKDSLFVVRRGFSYGSKFDSLELTKQYVDNNSALIQFVIKSHGDYGIWNKVEAKYNSHVQDLNKIEFLEPSISVRKIYIAFSKNGAKGVEIAEAFAKKLGEIKDTSVYTDILDKYTKSPGQDTEN